MPAKSKSGRSPEDKKTHIALDSPKTGAEDLKKEPPDGASDAKLPHERDEDVDMTGGTPSPEMQQAHRDISRGLQDTGRGPEADRAYKKLKR